MKFITRSDINIDYLGDTHRKNQLNLLLTTYNLLSTVECPTRIQKYL